MILDTLITDRTQADVSRAVTLNRKGFTAMTATEKAEYLAGLKGSYNATDLNRVGEACEYVANRMHQYGYAVDVQKIPHQRGGQSRLPEGYTELVSIQSTGTQYIDTQINPTTNNISVDVKFNSSVASESIFGAQIAWGSASYSLGTNTASFGANGSTSISYNDGVTHDANFSNGKLTVDGVVKFTWSGTFNIARSLFLFANNEGATVYKSNALSIYSCQIYDNGSLVRDFVPCINPQNAVGLYDLVTEQFFGNAGTGNFVAGAAVVELPDGYTQLEYIQSSGTQYIDTGFIPNSNTRIVAEIQAITLDTGGSFPFGSRKTYSDRALCVALRPTGVFSNYGSNYQWSNYSNPYERMTIDENKNITTFKGSQTVTISLAAASFTCTGALYLFATRDDGGVYYISQKLYACQIYDNGTLVRNFVPCKNSEDALGLYDLLNGVFYGNGGSGTFTGGSEIAPPAPPPVVDYEWIMSDIPTPAEMAVYIANIQNLRDVFTLVAPQAPSDAERMTYAEANNIEQILILLDDAITRMTYAFRHSGTFYSNMGGLFL